MTDYSRIAGMAVSSGISAKFLNNEPMSRHTTFKVGGPASLLIIPDSIGDLVKIYRLLKKTGIEPFIIGNGSNLIVSDKGVDKVIIKTVMLNKITIAGDGLISADAGVLLTKLSMFAKNNSLTGIEFIYGIPGTLGGAVFMNAGAYGSEIKNVIKETTCLLPDGSIKYFNGEEHGFSYRSSFFNKNNGYLIINSTLKLKQGNKVSIEQKMDELMERRRQKQPLEFPSAGSVFKRPEGFFAGDLIERSGLKGFTIGGAKVSEKHAGFIINFNNATCDNILELINHIQQTVYANFGVKLECEVKHLS